MTTAQIMELFAAAAFFFGGVILYRRGAREDRQHGSQGAVLLFALAVILAIHGSGLLEYRPHPSEMAQ